MNNKIIQSYFETLHRLIVGVEVTNGEGALGVEPAFAWVAEAARQAHDNGNKLMFIGNGGSAGITSHMATDYSKNGNFRSVSLNDASMLTCLGNDYGYEHVYSKQIDFYAQPGDVLIAISSSGQSANILGGVETARNMGCRVVTFSGFAEGNPLRKAGDVNFYVKSKEYGFVELAHQSLLHAILDLSMGWSGEV